MAATPNDDTNDGVENSLVDKYVAENGSTIETRETDDGTVEEQCPNCGSWYQRIASHWGQSSCDHPPISEKKWEMCKGLMMGDGSLGNKNRKNCNIYIGNTNVTFLEYLQDEFGWLASTFCQRVTAQKVANQLNGRVIGNRERNTQPEDCVDAYNLVTRSHPVFNHFEQWWMTGEKVFPQIEYTKPLLRMWWVSDGSFDWKSLNNCRIQFASRNEASRPENIIQSFKDIGFDCSLHSDSLFSLPVSQTEDFFDYIGHDPVPGFEYKWAYEDKDRYERLKEQCREEHCTQTLE